MRDSAANARRGKIQYNATRRRAEHWVLLLAQDTKKLWNPSNGGAVPIPPGMCDCAERSSASDMISINRDEMCLFRMRLSQHTQLHYRDLPKQSVLYMSFSKRKVFYLFYIISIRILFWIKKFMTLFACCFLRQFLSFYDVYYAYEEMKIEERNYFFFFNYIKW